MSNVNIMVSQKDPGYLPPPPVFNLQPFDVPNARDVFSLPADVSSTGTVDRTPKGQLPDHLKVVGILISHPSQIIIEDSFVNKTFFINEGEIQDGIKIIEVNKNQMIINYQGEDIPVPVK